MEFTKGMNSMKLTGTFLFMLIILACSNSNSQTTKELLAPNEFSEKLANSSDAIIVDVRTPGEYDGGHIANSLNINYNDAAFTQSITKIDKTKPVFVYCLSGGRSGKAAKYMRKNGFKEVYELDGGMMAWRAQNLDETKDVEIIGTEMTTADFEKLIASDNYVLIDFYADWCAPCKKLKPILEEIEMENKDKVTVVRIDADKNPTLAKQLGVSGLPAMKLYKNRNLVWDQLGLVNKQVILEQLK